MIEIVFNKDENKTIAYDNKKQIGECDFKETKEAFEELKEEYAKKRDE